MKYSWIDTELLQKPSVTKDLQAEWNWIRYNKSKTGGKCRINGVSRLFCY